MAIMDELAFFKTPRPKVFEGKPNCRNAWCGYAGRTLLSESEAKRWERVGMKAVECKTAGQGWHIVSPEHEQEALTIR